MRRDPTAIWPRSRPTERCEETRLRRIAAFRFHTASGSARGKGFSIALCDNRMTRCQSLALGVRQSGNERYGPLVGCRRPFTPSTEGWSRLVQEPFMKTSTPQPIASEPIGIVITTGARPPVEPRVRAYVWGPVPDEPELKDGTRAA